MIIDINEQWRIGSDRYQWILYRHKRTGTCKASGEPIYSWVAYTYHPTLKDTLQGFYDAVTRTSDVSTPEECVRVFEDTATLIKQKWGQFDEALRKL